MDPQEMMGFKSPGDHKVPVSVRDWNALKLALWRSKVAWEIAAHEAEAILDRCIHAAGCAGKDVETEPCLRECQDRELRMSALVVLNASRQCSPANARRPTDGTAYFAPSREYFSEVLAELAATQIEIERLRHGVPSNENLVPGAPSPLAALAAATDTERAPARGEESA